MTSGLPPGGHLFSWRFRTDRVHGPVPGKLTESLGQPVIVNNRPGAGGNIDGTLIASIEVHQKALLRTLVSFEFPSLNTDWVSYRHHTDSWIFEEAYTAAHGVPPSFHERQEFELRLETAFADAFSSHPTVTDVSCGLRQSRPLRA